MGRKRRRRGHLPMDMLDATGEADQSRRPDQEDGLKCCDLLRGLEHLPGEKMVPLLPVRPSVPPATAGETYLTADPGPAWTRVRLSEICTSS